MSHRREDHNFWTVLHYPATDLVDESFFLNRPSNGLVKVESLSTQKPVLWEDNKEAAKCWTQDHQPEVPSGMKNWFFFFLHLGPLPLAKSTSLFTWLSLVFQCYVGDFLYFAYAMMAIASFVTFVQLTEGRSVWDMSKHCSKNKLVVDCLALHWIVMSSLSLVF